MRLGNSLGNNKGKKYLRKDEIDIVFATKADHFNEWFDKNYNSLVSFMQSKGFYDEDVFHETYQNIYEKILFSGIEGNDYKPYIMRAYYTNFINAKSKEGRYCELRPNMDRDETEAEEMLYNDPRRRCQFNNALIEYSLNSLRDRDYFTEIEIKRRKLESDIMDYIYSSYNIRDFELFKMYISLKPAVNYATLAQITKLKAHNIQRTISKIKKDIRENKEFANRRKEIL